MCFAPDKNNLLFLLLFKRSLKAEALQLMPFEYNEHFVSVC